MTWRYYQTFINLCLQYRHRRVSKGIDCLKITLIPFFLQIYEENYFIILFIALQQMQSLSSNFDVDASLEQIMKRQIRSIMELPTQDQIYDYASFKLGAFYKRFWENNSDADYKQNTRKAGEIIVSAEKMRPFRQDDRLVKVCAYARQIRKFTFDPYKDWKKYIWIDLQPEERKVMEEYVEQLTPPIPYPGEPKDVYEKRQKEHMFSAYKRMKRGMLLVEVFEKIWTIRVYRKNNKPDDVERHQKNTREMLAKIESYHPNLRGYLSTSMGPEQWKEIEQMW